jgi:hypothetical protein
MRVCWSWRRCVPSAARTADRILTKRASPKPRRSLANPAQRAVVARLVGERLTDAVHLVVRFPLREGQQFGFELGQEGGSPRKQHGAGLELGLVDIEAADFVPLWLNDPRASREMYDLQFLRERSPDRCVFDQRVARPMLLRQPDRGFPQARILVAPTGEVDQVIVVVGRANRPVILGAFLRSRVPALDDGCAAGAFRQRVVNGAATLAAYPPYLVTEPFAGKPRVRFCAAGAQR